MNLQNNKKPVHIKLNQELYIVRHAETDYNKKQIIQGRGVNASINKTGQQQARSFYQGFKNIAFDQIFTSYLKRTQETMAPFVEKGYSLSVHPELDEIDWGQFEGQVSNDLLKSSYRDITEKWRQGYLYEKMPGGESALQLQKRQRKFIKEILNNHSGKILICTHGRAMRSLLCTLLGHDLHCMDNFPHVNMSLYKLVGQEGHYEIELFNYTGHLDTRN